MSKRKKEIQTKELSQQRFGKYADSYVSSQTHAKGEDLKILLKMADPQKHWKVLDVATGGGHTALLFAPYVDQVVATDISEKMLEAARGNITAQDTVNVSFEVSEAENLKFDTDKFDLVSCRIASHHFPNCQSFIKEANRVLKTGGILLLQDHYLPESEADGIAIDNFERLRDPSHNKAFSKSAWLTMFEAEGFQVMDTQEVIKQHKFFPWADRQGCSDQIKAELIKILRESSPVIKEWLQPHGLGTADPVFSNRHLIIKGKKV